VVFFLVNPKVWIALAVLFVLALVRRQWRSWRARRRAAAAARHAATGSDAARTGEPPGGPRPQVRRPA
jgi:uncharacterized membrane protein